jgi:hypothetical protein
MVMHFGSDRYTYLRQGYVRYRFFSDPINQGADAISGWTRP